MASRLAFLLALAAVAVLALLAAGPASAIQPATTPEAEFIIIAVEHSKVGGLNTVNPNWYSVRRMRVSTINPAHAAAFLAARPAARNRFQSTNVLLRRRGGTWRVLDLDDISCGLAPRLVLRELFGGCVPD